MKTGTDNYVSSPPFSPAGKEAKCAQIAVLHLPCNPIQNAQNETHCLPCRSFFIFLKRGPIIAAGATGIAFPRIYHGKKRRLAELP